MSLQHEKGSHDIESHAQAALRRRLEIAIFDLLEKRQAGKTCCPSEAAQKVDPTKWRDLMPLTRDVARKLRSEGLLEICQRGTVVMSDAWTGPIRLRLASHKLTTGKPCQSASSTEALGAGVGSRSGSPPVALEVAKKRCGVKRPKDSGDGQGTKLRLSVSYGNSLVVKKRDGAKHSQD